MRFSILVIEVISYLGLLLDRVFSRGLRAAEKTNYPNLLVSWSVFSVSTNDEIPICAACRALNTDPYPAQPGDNLFFPRALSPAHFLDNEGDIGSNVFNFFGGVCHAGVGADNDTLNGIDGRGHFNASMLKLVELTVEVNKKNRDTEKP
jgi:hypothetical protein